MTTAFAFARARLLARRRAALGAAILGLVALLALFAELVASPAPIVAIGSGRVLLLPGVTRAAAYEALPRAEIDRLHAGDLAIWPLVRHGPLAIAEAGPLAPSSREHPLGTDARGRDLAARLIYGARTALGLALGAVLASALLGVALGGLAGLRRGFWNERLVRLVETVDTFPAIIVVALVRAIEREPSTLSLAIAIGCVRWAEVARLVRAEVLRAGSADYVLAARALGAGPSRVFFRHLLPGAIAPVLVSSVFGVASVVLLEAAVSFLGMGAPPRAASWGETLAQGAAHPEHARLVLLPSLALLATVGAAWLVADALRDALDPREPRALPEPEPALAQPE